MAPPRRWIRLDVGWEDSWLDAIGGAAAGCWPRLLCTVKRDGMGGQCKRMDPKVAARRWRVNEADVLELETAAIADGALRIEGGAWVVVNWAEYQDIDPTAADRKRRQREREKEQPDDTMSRPVTRDTTVTRHATETLTLTEITSKAETPVGLTSNEAPPRKMRASRTQPAPFPKATPDQCKALRVAIEQYLHLGRPPAATRQDGSPWDIRNEMSIALRLAKQHGAEALIGAIGVCRKALRFPPDEQLSMRIFNGAGRRQYLNDCIAYWRKTRMQAAPIGNRIGDVLGRNGGAA